MDKAVELLVIIMADCYITGTWLVNTLPSAYTFSLAEIYRTLGQSS